MIESKKCSRCKLILPLAEFHNAKSSKDGKQHRCRKCSSELYQEWLAKNPDYHKDWRDKNKEHIDAVDRIWRENNKERIKTNNARWREENPEHVKEYNREWRQKNKDKHTEASYAWRAANHEKAKDIKKRLYERQKDDPQYKIDNAMRSGMHVSIVKGSKARRKWESLVGYSLKELMAHLERQFKPGMSWENYGRGGWSIDHKIPRSVFNYKTPDDIDFKRCWALDNLQPLWEPDNIRKSNKLIGGFQPSLTLAVNDNTDTTTNQAAA